MTMSCDRPGQDWAWWSCSADDAGDDEDADADASRRGM